VVSGQESLVLAAHAADLLLILGIVRAAWRALQVAENPLLRRFAVGFALVGVSHVFVAALDYGTTASVEIPEGSFDMLDALFWGYYLAAAIGFALVFASFGRHPFRWAPVLTPVLLIGGPLLEGLLLVELFFIVLHAGLNHIVRARGGSLRTALGFFALLLGHFLFFLDYQPLTPRAPIGELPTTLGYALLWLAIARPQWKR